MSCQLTAALADALGASPAKKNRPGADSDGPKKEGTGEKRRRGRATKPEPKTKALVGRAGFRSQSPTRTERVRVDAVQV